MINKITVFIIAGLFNSSIQALDYDGYIGGYFMLVDSMDAPKGYCFDLQSFGRTANLDAPVIVHACKNGLWKDGTWMVDYPQKGNIYVPAFDRCAAAESLKDEADFVLQICSDSQLQRFVFEENGKVLAQSNREYCLAVADTSQGSGAGIRRSIKIAACEKQEDKYVTWVVPREDTVYPPINYTASETTAQATPAARRAGPGGPGEGHQFLRACGPCHAENGQGYQSEHSPKLSGLSDWYLNSQMLKFKNGLRGNHEGERWATQMSYHVSGFTQDQITSFVDYMVSLEDVPSTATISGDAERGEILYKQNCALCHGADGMGNQQLNSPRLAGMSDWYLVKQLRLYREGLRGDHPEDTLGAQMVAFAKMLPDDAASNDVISYLNSIAIHKTE